MTTNVITEDAQFGGSAGIQANGQVLRYLLLGAQSSRPPSPRIDDEGLARRMGSHSVAAAAIRFYCCAVVRDRENLGGNCVASFMHGAGIEGADFRNREISAAVVMMHPSGHDDPGLHRFSSRSFCRNGADVVQEAIGTALALQPPQLISNFRLIT
jgi:hypothetical protein